MTDVEIIRLDALPPSKIARGFDGVTAPAAGQPT
jgi:hypothetical protein